MQQCSKLVLRDREVNGIGIRGPFHTGRVVGGREGEHARKPLRVFFERTAGDLEQDVLHLVWFSQIQNEVIHGVDMSLTWKTTSRQ